MAEDQGPAPDAGPVLRRLGKLLTHGSEEDVFAEGVQLLREVAGAKCAALLLLSRESGGEYWDAPDEETRELLAEKFADLAVEIDGAHEPIVRIHAGREPLLLRATPFGPAREPLGALCLALAQQGGAGFAADDVDHLASILASRVSMSHEIQQLLAEKARHERWFQTLDGQLRLLDRERQKFVAVVSQSDTYTLLVDSTFTVKWTNNAMNGKGATLDMTWVEKPLADVWKGLRIQAPIPGSARCPAAKALREDVVVKGEFPQTVDDGTRDLYLTALPITGPDGRPDEALLMLQDVSDLEVLRRSESRYRALFERSPDAMLMVDPESHRIVLANPVASSLTEWEPGELREKSIGDIHDPRDWDSVRELYEHAFRHDEPVVTECVLLTRSARRVAANLSAIRFDLDGQAVILVEFQDITERKRLQDELRHSQKMEAIGRLAGGVAHDFNNILTIIMGHSEKLIAKLDEGHGLAKTAENVHKAAVRGSLLTRQLLAFSRKDVLKREPLDLGEVVHGIEAMLRSLVGASIELLISIPDEPCLIRADRGQMEQILMNLVVNARDAIPDGGHIWIELGRVIVDDHHGGYRGSTFRGPGVELVVRDDGVGMDDRTQSRLFEPFFTTKEQGKGTGLGLSSAYGIVQECGGHIEVSSKVGDGTTLRIVLPRFEGELLAPSRETMVSGIYTPGTETILVVEDEDEVRELASEVLQMSGYSVLSADSATQAIEVLDRHEVAGGHLHLLLTDVIMPGMTGGQLAQQVCATRPKLKILYMSGYSNDSIVQDRVAIEQAAFIQKPFTLEALSTKVREVLDTKLPATAS